MQFIKYTNVLNNHWCDLVTHPEKRIVSNSHTETINDVVHVQRTIVVLVGEDILRKKCIVQTHDPRRLLSHS